MLTSQKARQLLEPDLDFGDKTLKMLRLLMTVKAAPTAQKHLP
jgi:hypothetical protein